MLARFSILLMLFAHDAWADTPAELPRKQVSVEYDIESFQDHTPLANLETCKGEYTPTTQTQSGHRIKMLGGAFVYMGPANGKSVFGHVAERYVYCRDEELVDVIYQSYPFSEDKIAQLFADRFQIDFASLSPGYQKSLRKALILDESYTPATVYAQEQFYNNRTIYEAWFDFSEEDTYKMLVANVDRFTEEKEKIVKEIPLPRYGIIDKNCTDPIKDDLTIVNPRYFDHDPSQIFRTGQFYNYVKNHNVEKILVYPSQRLFRIMRMKAEGHSTFFEDVAPLSKASSGAHKGWVFMIPDTHTKIGAFFMRPVSGVVNLIPAAAETAYGIVTTPINLVAKIPGLHFLKVKNGGVGRVEAGGFDIAASVAEVFWIRVRFPGSSAWTDEEREFFKGLNQTSALLGYFQSKFDEAPIAVSN